jgi:1,4-alpha-glucan branching enzyme
MRILRIVLLLILPIGAWAQSVSLNPTITPALFGPNDQITVTYNVTGTPLANLSVAYLWVWIPGKNTNALYNINPASSNTSLTNNAMCIKTVAGGQTTFSKTFTPSAFFATSIAAETQMGILLKGNDWSNGQTTDFIANFGFKISLTSPLNNPVFVTSGNTIAIQATAPVAATFETFVNNISVNTSAGPTTSYSYTHTATEPSGLHTVRVVGTSASGVSEVSFQYVIRSIPVNESRPQGIIPGINYDTDPSKVTLCLWAPTKTNVYVRGDFTDWNILPENLMKRDGEYFWIELNGLTPGQEYAYQYLLNETTWIADPYADKILDPDDQYIPASTYPNLKAYPAKALSNNWYFNRLSVFQTNQQAYQWQATAYQRPAKEKLVVYELLIRDFFDANNRNYQTLIDTLSYLKRLGVNAIELMPVMEFNGNDSWGYNPTFMFAVDKYYGTKNKLKEFIDICHQHGMAVILDIAMNHQDIPNSYAMMDFNFTTFKPTAENKWFNIDPKHPFNVFFDMNHESSYTKAYLDTVNHYWLNEFKVDGYRFDLSKGFTQTNTFPNNVSGWSAYDASRITLLKRMADKIWDHTPDAYVILEHFATNSEEKELAEYRANEGKGMLFWGNLNNAYMQNAMGYAQDSDINWVYHGSRGWSVPHVIGYMESHDEERMMFKNKQFGNTNLSPPYNVKDIPTGLNRVKAASTIFYTVPGPKMLWQFGELGYDISIDQGGRVSPKPVKWEYREDYQRYRVYEHIADLIRLRHEYNIFTEGAATLSGGNTSIKQMSLKNKNYTTSPSTAGQMNAQVVVNFDVKQNPVPVSFPHIGTWYDYYAYGNPIVVTSLPHTITLAAGEYKLYTDVEITNPVITSLEEEISTGDISVYPNPLKERLNLETDHEIRSLRIVTLSGAAFSPPRIAENTWDVSALQEGFYIVVIELPGGMQRIKVIKN